MVHVMLFPFLNVYNNHHHHHLYTGYLTIIYLKLAYSDGHVVLGVNLQPLSCGDCGFESR